MRFNKVILRRRNEKDLKEIFLLEKEEITSVIKEIYFKFLVGCENGQLNKRKGNEVSSFPFRIQLKKIFFNTSRRSRSSFFFLFLFLFSTS